ncbi:MAG TPA: M1 family metallopeptidase [Acidimicrobiales bacterium]|nr:M1 family metallopeptidase [Acidimicrobiales bacterium]
MAGHESYRLPRHARPRRYELELHPDLARARFDGRAVITVDVTATATSLVLNAADLDVSEVRLVDPAGSELRPDVRAVAEEQQLVLDFGRELAVGDGYRLTLEFSGVLNDQLRGFYRSTFRDGDGAERVIATTQFESTDARRAFPCWDEPDFKAVFSVTLVVEEGLTGLSNAALLSERRLEGGRTELRFADTMSMSTYLVAFVVGPYELTGPVDADGVPIRFAAVPGKLGLSGFAADAAVHAVRFLTGYFGIAYPGDKLDHVAVPDFAFGAMENLGCVTYRENLLLADPAAASQTELQRIATVVAHETAHMWFGDLVTMKWWNGIWLNEAFATFMEFTTTDHFRPEWQVWSGFGAAKASALGTDGLQATRPVEFAVGRPEEAEGMFDVLTYEKGGSVLRMLEQYLGPEVFRQGISRYLSTHSYGNTETSDLWDALESVSAEPVRTIMESWIFQGGYPLVTISPGDDPSSVVLRQGRFVYSGEAGGARWKIPVNLRASVGGRVVHERVLIDGDQTTWRFDGQPDWVVVNDGGWGFYRTRYAPDLRARLIAAGPAQVLTPLEQLQLLGDTWASVVAGQAELGEWAELAAVMAGVADPDVWGAILEVLHALDVIGDGAEREAVQAFARRLARPVWDGWDPAPGEDERTAIARSRILMALAGTGRDEQLRAEACERFRAHISGGAALPPDLVAVTARLAVSAGGPDAWSETLAAYRRAERPQDQLRYLFALAETPDPDLRRRTLDMTLDAEVRSQNAPFVIASVMSQHRAAGPAWGWLESNWARIQGRLPVTLLIRVMEGTAAVVDEEVAAAVHRFFDTHELPVSDIRTRQVLERMDVNVSLAGRLAGKLASGLGAAGPS